MTAHHATYETLMRYAAGTLATGPRIVAEAHIASCPLCSSAVRKFEALGGEILQTTEPTSLAPEALANVLSRIDADEIRSSGLSRSTEIAEIDGVRLPDSLIGCEIGRWRWIGPGMHMSRIVVPHDREASVILLKIGPGRALPDHGHDGAEFTYVVKGSFSDRLGQFRPGDLAETDEEIEHQPVVDPDGECICLAAMEGKMRFNGVIARMLQPIFGI